MAIELKLTEQQLKTFTDIGEDEDDWGEYIDLELFPVVNNLYHDYLVLRGLVRELDKGLAFYDKPYNYNGDYRIRTPGQIPLVLVDNGTKASDLRSLVPDELKMKEGE